MRRITQFAIVAILLSASTVATACCGYDYTKEDFSGYNLQPNLQIEQDSQYSRNGKAVYLYAGFLNTMRFLNGTSQTASNGSTTISYIPKNSMPDNFYGFEVGVGKELNRRIDAQLAYFQNLHATRNSTINGSAASISGKMYGMQGLLGFVINPNDRFQVMPLLGVKIYKFQQSIIVGGVHYTSSMRSLRTNPMAGAEFTLFCTERFALRLRTAYTFDTSDVASDGAFDAMMGLSYTV